MESSYLGGFFLYFYIKQVEKLSPLSWRVLIHFRCSLIVIAFPKIFPRIPNFLALNMDFCFRCIRIWLFGILTTVSVKKLLISACIWMAWMILIDNLTRFDLGSRLFLLWYWFSLDRKDFSFLWWSSLAEFRREVMNRFW